MDGITGDFKAHGANRSTHNIAIQSMADFTGNIERMVEIEAALGVRLNALSAMTDEDGDLAVMGEVHFSEAPENGHTYQIHLLAYDAQGRVVGKEYTYVGSEGIPFDSFDINVYDLPSSIGKIRVYVKKD
jgi:hypothetical protein